MDYPEPSNPGRWRSTLFTSRCSARRRSPPGRRIKSARNPPPATGKPSSRRLSQVNQARRSGVSGTAISPLIHHRAKGTWPCVATLLFGLDAMQQLWMQPSGDRGCFVKSGTKSMGVAPTAKPRSRKLSKDAPRLMETARKERNTRNFLQKNGRSRSHSTIFLFSPPFRSSLSLVPAGRWLRPSLIPARWMPDSPAAWYWRYSQRPSAHE